MPRLRLGVLALSIALVVSAVMAVRGTGAANAGSDSARGGKTASQSLEVATFGSGCFWCTESDFDKVEGVVSTVSGYMGGKTTDPTYKSVSTGRTGHIEVLQVKFDPARVSYAMLLDYYWHHADIVDGGGQFCDRGNQYRPAIFAHTPEQKRLAQAGKTKLDKSGQFKRPVAVEIIDASKFTAAEGYHQNYYKKNPVRYRYYRYGCGRDARLRQLWGTAATH